MGLFGFSLRGMFGKSKKVGTERSAKYGVTRRIGRGDKKKTLRKRIKNRRRTQTRKYKLR